MGDHLEGGPPVPLRGMPLRGILKRGDVGAPQLKGAHGTGGPFACHGTRSEYPQKQNKREADGKRQLNSRDRNQMARNTANNNPRIFMPSVQLNSYIVRRKLLVNKLKSDKISINNQQYENGNKKN